MIFSLFSLTASAQVTFRLSGIVTGENGSALPGVFVVLGESESTLSNADGVFTFPAIVPGVYPLRAQYAGYREFSDSIELKSDISGYQIRLAVETMQLDEVIISSSPAGDRRRMQSQSAESVNADFIIKNLDGNLVKTLSRIPGIATIDIGPGQSKPIIRGLSFNRVVVAENGIKHEGQQWGADHGLEIDRFNAGSIEIIKGPASLIYGSDAIGGVISLRPFVPASEDGIGGSVLLHGASNNNLLGLSANTFIRKRNRYFTARITGITHGDYKVPADTIEYNTYDFALKDNYLRNTAGRELNFSLSGGISGKWGMTSLTVGNFLQKAGFYADAHGFEIRLSQIDYDGANRDIDLPFQQVNHFKVISNSILFVGNNKFEIDLAYQNNFRKEFSEPTEHGYRPLPPDSLERKFDKDIWSLKVGYYHYFSEKHFAVAGAGADYQVNRIGGWGYIIPAFDRWETGFFVYDNLAVGESFYLNAGVRFDAGKINVHEYYDWYATPQFDDDGNLTGEVYMQRSPELEKTFTNLTWSGGFSFTKEKCMLKMNLGKSFRIPGAQELASEGVNYHLFRQEKGDSTLVAEKAWQVDLLYEFKSKSTTVAVSPFYSWFPNYIYLNPTSEFSSETGLQVYNFVQNEMIRWGGELRVIQKTLETIDFSLGLEYVYSEQISGDKKGFGLAFSPPLLARVGFQWLPEISSDIFRASSLSVDWVLAAAQNRIVPPEEPTPGYQVVNLSAGTEFRIGKQWLSLSFQVNNLFNQKYLDHTSFYRIINIPSPARNFQFVLQIPFGLQRDNERVSGTNH